MVNYLPNEKMDNIAMLKRQGFCLLGPSADQPCHLPPHGLRLHNGESTVIARFGTGARDAPAAPA
jgi:hypothetical protein